MCLEREYSSLFTECQEMEKAEDQSFEREASFVWSKHSENRQRIL